MCRRSATTFVIVDQNGAWDANRQGCRRATVGAAGVSRAATHMALTWVVAFRDSRVPLSDNGRAQTCRADGVKVGGRHLWPRPKWT
jgi:hypothetical protein